MSTKLTKAATFRPFCDRIASSFTFMSQTFDSSDHPVSAVGKKENWEAAQYTVPDTGAMRLAMSINSRLRGAG
jgi:hypothetical protein